MVSAIAVIKGVGIEGTVTFRQEREGTPVYINGIIYGLKGGYHGMHIHQFPITNGCASAGEHYNPFKRQHGAPRDSERHYGDLGNIDASYQTGIAIISKRDTVMSLFGEFSIIGRTLVIHADRDDLGKGGQPDSKTTGHSGARVACGVLVRQ